MIPPLAAGARVGPYEIVAHLKSGGMGDVFSARDVRSGEAVALKLRADRSDVGAARFAREGRVATRLDHPNIVRVIDRGGDAGVQYLAMELLRGRDLEAALRDGPMRVDDAVALAVAVCDALAHAHAAGVIHRDLKPGNIFLCDAPSAAVKVLDFGIARVDGESGVTRTGKMVGTVAYISPEQCRGDADLDARADLWSLGVVLYECLAGRAPFVAATLPGVLFQIVAGEAPDLRALRPEVPAWLASVVHRALRRARDERPPSAEALRDALRAGDLATATGRGAHGDTTARDDERRLVAVAYLAGVSNHALVADLADDLGGRVVPLRDRALLVLFGAETWLGDEPLRAARFASAAALGARAVSVSLGRATRSAGGVEGRAVDDAVSGAPASGVRYDAATSAAVRGAIPLAWGDDGSARPTHRAPDDEAAGDGEHATPFLGRDVELALLLQTLDDAATRRQAAGALVTGSEGIGKSRLCHEALSRLRAQGGSTVLLARCEAMQRDAPLAAVVRALRPVIDPALGKVLAEPGRRADPQAAMDHARRVVETVLRGLSARGPVVMALDDAQWLDASSVALLRGLCDAAEDLPFALWCFARPESRDTLATVIPGATQRELAPLPRPLAQRLLRAVAPDAPDAVLERAGGHPLFLEQLGALWAARGDAADDALPASVEGAILAQLDRLAPDEREFVKRAAVYGPVAWTEGVEALGGVASAVEGLRRRGVLSPRAQGRFAGFAELAFRSHLLREVAYGLWPDAQRPRLHDAAGRWLSARTGVGPDELAAHWDLAGDVARAARCHADAARRAADINDADATMAHAARALARCDDDAVRWDALVARDDVLQLGPDRGAQREGLDALDALATTRGVAARAEVAWRRCFHARVGSDLASAERHGESAIALADASDHARVRAAARIEMALLRADQGRHDEALRHATEARAMAQRLDAGWLGARAMATVGYVCGEAGDAARALDAYQSAAEGFRRAGDLRRAAVVQANAGTVRLGLGRVAEAAEALRAALDDATRAGNRATAAIATHNLGIVRRVQGDLAAARELQSRAADEAARMKHLRLASAVASERVYLALAAGDDAVAACAGVTESAAATRASPLIATATAVVARATGDSTARATLRAMAEAQTGAARVELLAAVCDVGPRDDDAAALADAVDAVVSAVADEDREACRATLRARYRIAG